ncbi:YopX family protein [Streptococcus sp. 5004]|uniref:YopX family protein n=1 Tax=Streptococcus sp. 5004 TaxID=2582670 RepID=UPI00156783B1|nr:YopX family protein [Streptococcus sp. 5004]
MIPKFRAWDRLRKEMNYKVMVGNCDTDDENWICPIIWNQYRKKWLHFDDYECIMQSTGLKDKNGKEIFVGDVLEIQGVKMIVKFGSYKYLETSKNNGHILGILHDGLGFYVECINAADPDNISPFEPETLKNSQIIGNIYENREILMGK